MLCLTMLRYVALTCCDRLAGALRFWRFCAESVIITLLITAVRKWRNDCKILKIFLVPDFCPLKS